jgi:hypothetical protein
LRVYAESDRAAERRAQGDSFADTPPFGAERWNLPLLVQFQGNARSTLKGTKPLVSRVAEREPFQTLIVVCAHLFQLLLKLLVGISDQ